MPRIKRAPPDTRLDWRDPNMPVLRPFEDRWGRPYLEAVSPEEEQEWRKEVMRSGLLTDNSDYDLAKKTKAKRRRRLNRMMKK